MVSFSDEFTAYAKEEDAINNQHSSNWILCYVIITIIPFAFVASAWWSTRQHKKAKAAARAGRWEPPPQNPTPPPPPFPCLAMQ